MLLIVIYIPAFVLRWTCTYNIFFKTVVLTGSQSSTDHIDYLHGSHTWLQAAHQSSCLQAANIRLSQGRGPAVGGS